jgi:hemolysin III
MLGKIAYPAAMSAIDTARHLREEIANALSHGLGVVLGLLGGGALIALAAVSGSTAQLVGAIVFVVSLVLLYTASTLYHAIPHPVAKRRLKVFDHCAIYVLIAGTYTPFLLTSLRPHGGLWMLGLIWTLAAAGVVYKLFYTGRFKGLSTLIYLAMGWLVVIGGKPFMSALGTDTLSWLLAGGIAYSVGTLFYLSRRLPYAHAIWHAFVLLGSVCHFVAVSTEVLPLAG